MKIGFTGTRKGMSASQKETFISTLKSMNDFSEFIHGGAIGADSEADDVVRKQFPNVHIEIVLPICYTAQELLKRNKIIVSHSDILIAAPKTEKEVLRSGTWATIRYARYFGKQIIMLR